jgi:hypothetical protein
LLYGLRDGEFFSRAKLRAGYGGNPVDCQHGALDEFNGPKPFDGPNDEETKAV